MSKIQHDAKEIARALSVLIEPGSTFEIRALGMGSDRLVGNLTGYFNDTAAATRAIAELWYPKGFDASGVYVIPSPVEPGFIFRAHNRMKKLRSSASDGDILRKRWFMLDVDPWRYVGNKKISGIPATEEELFAAIDRRDDIVHDLIKSGWPEPVTALSGNGAHALWRMDEDLSDPAHAADVSTICSDALNALDLEWSDDIVSVDRTVYNHSRIWKVYGTTGAKGDNTPERPWRQARIEHIPPAGLDILRLEDVGALAAVWSAHTAASAAESPGAGRSAPPSASDGAFDVGAFLDEHNVVVHRETNWGGSRLWVLRDCPWIGDESHRNGAWVAQAPSGMITHGCRGNRCKDKGKRTWPKLRAMLDPKYLERREAWEARERAGRAQASRANGSSSAEPACVQTRAPTAESEGWKEPEPAANADVETEAPPRRLEIVEQPPEPTDDQAAIAEIGRRLIRTPKGVVKAILTNVVGVLAHDPRWQGVLVFDDLALVVTTAAPPPWAAFERSQRNYRPGQEWSDTDDNRLRVWLQREYGFEPPQTLVRQAVDLAAARVAVHPVRRWLEQTGDGSAHDEPDSLLNNWLFRFAGASDGRDSDGEDVPGGARLREYTRLAGRKWLIAAVARAYPPQPHEDGVKADNVLILEGEQGARKSTLLRSLVPVERWFGDTSLDIGGKDGLLSLRGKWLYELAEIDGYTSRREVAAIKAYLTSRVDDYRAPYAARNSRIPRQVLFCATANKSEYLWDETGNRRFWPVVAASSGAIDIRGLIASLDMLWAQARAAFKSGEQWWPTDEQAPLFTSEQRKRVVSDVWSHAVEQWLAERLAGVWEYDKGSERDLWLLGRYPSPEQILTTVLGVERARLTNKHRARLNSIMGGLGWKACRVRVANRRIRVFKPIDESALHLLVPVGTAPAPPAEDLPF